MLRFLRLVQSIFPVQVVLLRIATELQQRMEYLFCRRLMSKMKLPVSLLEDEDGTREGNSRVESMGWCKQNSNCWSEVSLAAEFRGLMYILGHKVDEGEDRFYFTWQVRCRKGLVIITILILLFILCECNFPTKHTLSGSSCRKFLRTQKRSVAVYFTNRKLWLLFRKRITCNALLR